MAALCAFTGCVRKAHSRGWCATHYSQYNQGIEPRPIRTRRPNTGTKRSTRDVWLWMMYRLTVERYETLATSGCALCESKDDLVVDHDHGCCPGRKSCGVCVRGVLCRTHNVWLGMVADDPTFMDKAAGYLRGVRHG